MTGAAMAWRNITQLRRLLGATRHRMRAARMKVAAGRWIERARDLTRDRGETPLACFDPWHFGQQRLRVWVVRPIEYLFGRGTFHDPAKIHDQHAIREMFDHAQIVTDE